MSLNGKIRSLTTRPFQSSDLAFEIPGTLDWQNAGLKVGQRVSASHVVNGDEILNSFRQRAPDAASSIVFNTSRIKTELSAKALFRLRNSQEVISLDQAIAQRDMQYARIYRNTAAIADLVKNSAAEGLAHAKSAKDFNRQRFGAIEQAYDAEPDTSWRGVKKSTQTVHTSQGEVTNDLFVTPVGMTTPQYQIKAESSGSSSTQTLADSMSLPVYHDPSDSDPVRGWKKLDTRNAAGTRGHAPEFFSQRTIVQEDKNVRLSTNTTNEFWHPKFENKIEFDRLQSVMVQEELRAAINSLSAERIEDILKRELELLELEVLKAQSRLLSTFLTPTFPGIITAIYKDTGEYVQAGEPVARVENDSRLFLYGFVQLRAAPQIGQSATIRSKVYETPTERAYQANVVSIRGHNTDDDEWELLFERPNPATNDYLPLNFGFDPGVTTITFA